MRIIRISGVLMAASAPDETETRALSEEDNGWSLAEGDILYSAGK